MRELGSLRYGQGYQGQRRDRWGSHHGDERQLVRGVDGAPYGGRGRRGRYLLQGEEELEGVEECVSPIAGGLGAVGVLLVDYNLDELLVPVVLGGAVSVDEVDPAVLESLHEAEHGLVVGRVLVVAPVARAK
jgi:hypothetical protein